MTCPICNRPFEVTSIRGPKGTTNVKMVAELRFGIHDPIHVCLTCMDAVVDLPDDTRKLIVDEIEKFPPLAAAAIRKHLKSLVLH